MVGAFLFRHVRVLRRSAADTASMFVRPLVSGALFAVFAAALANQDEVSTGFLVISVAIANVATNTVVGAAYESRLDADGGRLGLIAAAPGGLGAYVLVQAVAQLVIAVLQSALVVLCFASVLDPAPLPAAWLVSVVALLAVVVGLAALGARRAALTGSFVEASFAISLLVVFAGAFYPVDRLPRWAELVSRANPLTALVDQVRAPLVGGEAAPVGGGTVALVAVAAAALWVAVVALARRRTDLSATSAQV